MNIRTVSGSLFYQISNNGATIINVTTTASINTASGNFTELIAMASASSPVNFTTMSFSDGTSIIGNYYLSQGTSIKADITYVSLTTSSAPILLLK